MRRLLPAIAGLCLLTAFATGFGAARSGALLDDPSRVLGPESCGECHTAEFETWKTTQHQSGFKEMHRLPLAQQIAEKLGIRSIKRAESCATCHYTVVEDRGRARARFGVSCESCHGPARDWIDLHDDFGGADLTRSDESEEHRKQRIEACIDKGMRTPERLLELARRCYDCHVVRDPELLAAGHPASADFELVAWSQGEMRHNFCDSKGEKNDEAPLHRRRLMFAMGAALELEHCLRALASTTAGPARAAVQERLERAVERVEAVRAALAGQKDFEAIAGAAATALAESAPRALSEAAATVQTRLQAFCGATDGSDLEGLDPLLPRPESYRGKARN